MALLDEITNKILEMRDQGVAIASVKAIVGDESIEIVVGRIETRDIHESGKSQSRREEEENFDSDLYHVR